jgi:pimeloyl-[acyl-carrier protein] methyl ester esterase
MATLGNRARPQCVEWWDCLAPSTPGALLDVLENAYEPAICVGWSLGGLLALEAATKSPGSVRAIVLLSSTAKMTSVQGYPGADGAAVAAMRRAIRHDRAKTLSEFFTACLAPAVRSRTLALLCRDAERIDSNHLISGLDYLMEADLRCGLSRIDMPVLVVHGDRDSIVPFACGQYLADNLPDARLVSLQGTGHGVTLSALETVENTVVDFLYDRVL